ncbi:MAG: zinc ribbon domain-containing protein [Bacilli bacterium]
MKKNIFVRYIMPISIAVFLVAMIVSAILEKGFVFYSYIFMTLMLLALAIFGISFLMVKETAKDEVIISEKATVICPCCGKENPSGSVYCSQCQTFLK